MATGGIFQLITNDGKQDRMLMATHLLNNRLRAIEEARDQDASISDKTPTLLDIERTHILFTNAHFKPFAAIGYEYNKVNVSSGTAAFGSRVTFSLPQFGDFFHDMVLHVKMTQPTVTTTEPASDQPLMRWCAYPGERLLKKVQFEVNGNPLDEYTWNATNFHREFSVQPNKQTGWNRCVGQEEREKGWIDQPNWVGSGVTSADVSHRFEATTNSGAQTPTGQKVDQLELFVPLLFWFNKDPRLAVPSVAIPYGQRFINIDLADQNELVGLVGRGANAGNWTNPGGTLGNVTIKTMELYINNIFVNPEVHNIFIKRIGFTLIRVHRQQTFSSMLNTQDVLLQQLKWPIEALFVGMRIADYNSSSAALRSEHLDKWHSFSKVVPTARAIQSWNSSHTTLKPEQYFNNAGVLALEVTGGVATDRVIITSDALEPGIMSGVAVGDTVLHAGFSMTVVAVDVDAAIGEPLIVMRQTQADAAAAGLVADVAAFEATIGAGTTTLLEDIGQQVGATVSVCTRTVDDMTIKAHGIPIYNSFPSGFYNAYLPLKYGGPNIRTPEDCGAMLVTFCLYPGTYQPSGHINVSRAREFYLEYTSSVIGNGTDGMLTVIASAINFLLISDGSAVLRYST
jgi:hypothetical protein